jgi:uncharacterized protein YutD
LHGLQIESVPNKLQGNVHINKTIILENFKGCRNITTTRRSNIWIIAAKGDEDSMIAIPAFKNCWNGTIFDERIYSEIQKGSYIVAYNDRYIALKAKKHNKNMVKEIKEDNRIKSIIMNIKKWLTPFKGIATKYLEEYLSFFILFNLDKLFNYIDMVSYLSLGNRFMKIKEIGV